MLHEQTTESGFRGNTKTPSESPHIQVAKMPLTYMQIHKE